MWQDLVDAATHRIAEDHLLAVFQIVAVVSQASLLGQNPPLRDE